MSRSWSLGGNCSELPFSPRLTTLLEVLEFKATNFLTLQDALSKMRALISEMSGFNGEADALEPLAQKAGVLVAEMLDTLEKALNEIKLSGADSRILRLKSRISKGGCSMETLNALLEELEASVREMLNSQHFLMLPEHEAKMFMEDQLDGQAADKFPSAKFDMGEAGKCFALDRWTACVFHVMRALEVGLKVMASELGVFDPAKPGWDGIIGRCNGAIKQFSSDTRGANWREDRDFFSQVATDFRFFKDAWRNHASHVGDPSKGITKYTKPEAQEILSHVKCFMEHLAKRFGEPGT